MVNVPPRVTVVNPWGMELGVNETGFDDVCTKDVGVLANVNSSRFVAEGLAAAGFGLPAIIFPEVVAELMMILSPDSCEEVPSVKGSKGILSACIPTP